VLLRQVSHYDGMTHQFQDNVDNEVLFDFGSSSGEEDDSFPRPKVSKSFLNPETRPWASSPCTR